MTPPVRAGRTGTTTGTAELRPSAAPARPPMHWLKPSRTSARLGPRTRTQGLRCPKTTPSLSAADTLDSRQRITIDA